MSVILMPKKIVCPACGSLKTEYNEQGDYYKCKKCQFIFDDSLMQTARNAQNEGNDEEEDDDPSINNPDEEDGESDLEEDLAFLDEEDVGW